jgi:hypothetical protein
MDTLKTLLASLNPSEFKELEHYIDGRLGLKERKDKELLEILSEDPPSVSDDVIRKLYGISKKGSIAQNKRNSYHQWRSILTGRTEDFILQRMELEDASLRIFKYILLARYLAAKGLYEATYRYLHKSEEAALRQRRYDLLQQTYSLQIEYAWTQPKLDMVELLSRWKNNQELEHKEVAILTALGVIRKQLKDAHREGHSLNIEQLIADTMHIYGVDVDSPQGGFTRYRIASIILVQLEEKEDYRECLHYLGQLYKSMEADQQLAEKSGRLETLMLSQLFRAALLGREYEQGEEYYQKLKKRAPDLEESPVYQFWGHMITCIFLACTNRLPEALSHIREVEKSNSAQSNLDNDDCFTALHSNLVFLHYLNKDLPEVQKYLARVMNREKSVKQHTGYAAIMSVHLFDCMVNIDKKEYEYVLTKFKAIRKRFHKFLIKPENKKHKQFLALLIKLSSNRDWSQSSRYIAQARDFIEHTKPVQGSGPFDLVIFQSYILSKLDGISYYQAFLQLVAPPAKQ